MIITDSGEGRFHYIHDANFNVVAMTDTSWNVKERYTYSPYGEVTILNGASDADSMVSEWSVDADQVSDLGNELLYTGRRLDPLTGLYYYRNRYYHAQLGRFVNRDPIGYEGSPYNLYEYVSAAPIDFADPFGHAKCPIAGYEHYTLVSKPDQTGLPYRGDAGTTWRDEETHRTFAYDWRESKKLAFEWVINSDAVVVGSCNEGI